MKFKVLRSESEHQKALQQAETLVALDPAPGSDAAEQLELLTVLIEDYEKRAFTFETLEPLEVIEFRMNEQGLRQRDLVSMIGSRSRVSEVLAGKRPLTVQMIRTLSTGLGIPADSLIGAEHGPSSRPDLGTTAIDWKKFPYGEMERRGWFNGVRISGKTTEERLQSFLSQVLERKAPTEALFRRRFLGIETEERSYYSTLAWTARVLMRAREASDGMPAFDQSRISSETLRDVARLSWLADGPRIAVDFLAKLGIAVVIESRLRNAVLDGAALLSEGRRPVIGLTLRIDRVDYFWFTLLHELAHVWRHLNDSDEAFVDRIERIASAERSPDAKENEANRIAKDALIKRSVWERCAARLAPSRENIQALADQLHIHPAIVAGRVQFETGQYTLFREFLGQGQVKKCFRDAQLDERLEE